MPAPRPTVFPLLLLAALAITLGAWTWMAWPDILIDFGREAYIPWRIAQGDTLYADLAYFNGPLSPHWNALLFSLFGTSLDLLFAANATLAAILAWRLYAIIDSLTDGFAAFWCTAVFLALFAFGHLVSIGNYNYIAPYSHELTHGVLLLTLLLGFLWRYAETRRSLIGVGACLGLAFLTKAEIFLAASAGTVVALAALAWGRAGRSPAPGTLARGAACAALPPLAAWIALSTAMPPGEAAAGILGTWAALSGSDVASLEFYRRGAGLDAPGANMLAMSAWALADVVIVGALLAAARRVGIEPSHQRAAAVVAFVGAVVLLAGLSGFIAWRDFWRPLPLLMVALFLWPLQSLGASADRARSLVAVRLAAIAIAGVLLGKMALHARIAQYGFALAMPATLVGVAALLHGLPRLVPAPPGRAALRAACLGLVVTVVGVHLAATQRQLARKTFRLETAHEVFLTDRTRGPAVSAALAAIDADLPADATVLVLPEGIMLNYLSRRATPTRHVNFMPPELAIYGEAEIVRELDEAPPDWVVLAHKDTAEYGAAFFGRDYGFELAGWVREHYRAKRRFGKPPFVDPVQFGIVVLERNAGAPSSSR